MRDIYLRILNFLKPLSKRVWNRFTNCFLHFPCKILSDINYFHTWIDSKSYDLCFQFFGHIFTGIFTPTPQKIASTRTWANLFYKVFTGPLGILLRKLKSNSLKIFFICWCIMIAWWSTSSSYRSYRNGNVSRQSRPSCIINKDQFSTSSALVSVSQRENGEFQGWKNPYPQTECCRSWNSSRSQTESIEKQESETNSEELI